MLSDADSSPHRCGAVWCWLASLGSFLSVLYFAFRISPWVCNECRALFGAAARREEGSETVLGSISQDITVASIWGSRSLRSPRRRQFDPLHRRPTNLCPFSSNFGLRLASSSCAFEARDNEERLGCVQHSAAVHLEHRSSYFCAVAARVVNSFDSADSAV